MPTYLLADVNWETVATTICGAVVSVVVSLGAGIKFFLGHLEKRETAQREHMEKREAAQREHEKALVAECEKMGSKFETAVKELATESRNDSRLSDNRFIGLHKEMVETIGLFGAKVGELSVALTNQNSVITSQNHAIKEQSDKMGDLSRAIGELRTEVAKKQDRHDTGGPRR